MKLRYGLVFFELLVALFLVAGPVGAQQPIVGGTLYVAVPGQVQTTLLGRNVPISQGWLYITLWSTGPGPQDWASAGDDWMYVPPPGGPSNANIGRRLSPTPVLAADTVVYSRTIWFTNNDSPGAMTLTGQPQPKDFGNTRDPRYLAAVFPGPGNTAMIGFSLLGAPLPANFLDYPLRILISNVCVR
jgi:hypothetical protein